MEDSYFQKWTYQLGFSFYESIVIFIFGESPRALKFLNILYSIGTVLVVYLAASKLFNELSGRMAGLISAFYIPSIIMCSVLTNQHLSTFFYFLALYLVINNGFIKKISLDHNRSTHRLREYYSSSWEYRPSGDSCLCCHCFSIKRE